MSSKCSYCWGTFKASKNIIVLECNHEFCIMCLLFINNSEIDYCPLCRKRIKESIFVDVLDLNTGENLGRVSSQNEKPKQLKKYNSLSDLFLTSIKSFKALNNFQSFDTNSINILTKASPTVSEILSDLNLIKQFNILNLSNLNESSLNSLVSSKPFRRVFCKIMFKEIELKYNEKDTVWVGSRLRIISNNAKEDLFIIKNDGDKPIYVYSIAFGININSPNTFELKKLMFDFSGEQFYGKRSDFVKDRNNISFSLKFPKKEIMPSQKLSIIYELEYGLYLSVVNQNILEYNGCLLQSKNQSKHSVLVYFKLK